MYPIVRDYIHNIQVQDHELSIHERKAMYWDAMDLADYPCDDVAAYISLSIINGWCNGLVWC